MECRYMCIECRIGYRRMYGIAAVDDEDGEKIILGAIIDVSENKQRVEKLIDKCNQDHVAFSKFLEIVNAFIEGKR